MRGHLVALGLLLFLAGVRYWPLLQGETLVLDADVLQDHQPTLRLMGEAVAEGRLPGWNPHQFSGSPYFGVIDKPFLYPPALLAVALTDSWSAYGWLVFSHAALGAFGLYLLVYHLTRSTRVSFLASALGLTSLFVVRLHVGLPYWGLADAWLAFAAWCAHRIVESERPARFGVLLGLCAALQVHAGGVFVASYTAMLCGCIGLLAPGPSSLGERARRAGLGLGVAALCAAGLTAVRFLPALEWKSWTTRDEGVGIYTALGERLDPFDPASWRQTSASLIAFASLGALGLALAPRRLLPYLAAASIGVVLATGIFHGSLYRWFPLYGDTRHVGRALVLYLPAFLVLGGLGTSLALERFGARIGRRLGRGALAVLAVAAAFFCAWDNHLFDAPSYAERLRTRPARLVERPLPAWSGEGSAGFRLYSNSRWDLARVYGQGLEATNGRLGGLRYARYEAALSRGVGPAFLPTLQLLGCHTAILRRERQGDLFTFLERMPDDVLEREGAKEPRYVYRVPDAHPRASRPAAVVGLPEDAPAESEAALLREGAYDPARIAVVRLPSSERAATDAWLGAWDPEEVGGHRRLFAPLAGQGNDAPTQRLVVRRAGGGLQVELDGGDRAGWVRLSGGYAFYPGWSARVDGEPTPLRVADGIVSAVRVPAGARRLVLDYRVPGLAAGAVISSASLLLALGALVFLRRAQAG